MAIMAKQYAKHFYNSHGWEECRAAFINERIRIDGGMCQLCGQRLGLIVHHVEKINEANINNAGVTLAHDNLMYLCHDCHNNVHRGDMAAGKMGEPFCIFTADGQPVDVRKF